MCIASFTRKSVYVPFPAKSRSDRCPRNTKMETFQLHQKNVDSLPALTEEAAHTGHATDAYLYRCSGQASSFQHRGYMGWPEPGVETAGWRKDGDQETKGKGIERTSASIPERVRGSATVQHPPPTLEQRGRNPGRSPNDLGIQQGKNLISITRDSGGLQTWDRAAGPSTRQMGQQGLYSWGSVRQLGCCGAPVCRGASRAW